MSFGREAMIETEKEEDFKFLSIHPPEGVTEKLTSVVFYPGFSQGADTLSPNLEALAKRGRHCMMVDAPKGGVDKIDKEVAGINKGSSGSDFAGIERRVASTNLVLMEKEGKEKVDIVAHSMGCIGAVLTALAYPEKVRSLVLVNPAAMIPENDLLDLAKRFKANIDFTKAMLDQDPVLKEAHLKGAKERKTNLLDMWYTIQKVHSLTKTQIINSLAILKEKGVKVVIIHDVNDKLFDMQAMQDSFTQVIKEIKEDGSKKQLLDGFYSINLSKNRESGKDAKGNVARQGKTIEDEIDNPTGHNDFYLQPDKYMEIVDLEEFRLARFCALTAR